MQNVWESIRPRFCFLYAEHFTCEFEGISDYQMNGLISKMRCMNLREFVEECGSELVEEGDSELVRECSSELVEGCSSELVEVGGSELFISFC